MWKHLMIWKDVGKNRKKKFNSANTREPIFQIGVVLVEARCRQWAVYLLRGPKGVDSIELWRHSHPFDLVTHFTHGGEPLWGTLHSNIRWPPFSDKQNTPQGRVELRFRQPPHKGKYSINGRISLSAPNLQLGLLICSFLFLTYAPKVTGWGSTGKAK